MTVASSKFRRCGHWEMEVMGIPSYSLYASWTRSRSLLGAEPEMTMAIKAPRSMRCPLSRQNRVARHIV